MRLGWEFECLLVFKNRALSNLSVRKLAVKLTSAYSESHFAQHVTQETNVWSITEWFQPEDQPLVPTGVFYYQPPRPILIKTTRRRLYR